MGLLIFGVTNISAQSLVLNYKSTIRKLQSKAEYAYLNGDYQSAIDHFEKAIHISVLAKDSPRQADLMVESSTVYFYSGNARKAISSCKRALQLTHRNTSLDSTRFKAYSNLSYYFSERNQGDSAQLYFNLADHQLETNTSLIQQTPSYVAAYYNQHGMYHNNSGDYIQAESNFKKAIQVATQYNLEQVISFFNNNLSALYENLGEYAKALQIALMSLQNSREEFRNIAYLINISHIYFKLGDTQKAYECLQKSKLLVNQYKKTRPAEIQESETMLYRNWGLYYVSVRRYKEADAAFNKAIELAQSHWGSHHSYLSLIFRDKAQLKATQYQLTEALVCYRKAIDAVYLGNLTGETDLPDLTKGILSEKDLLESLLGQASVLEKFPDRQKYLVPAFHTYRLALELAEHIRLNYDVADTKLLFGQQISVINERALEIGYQLYQKTHQYQYLETTFKLTESTRASTLSDARREQKLKNKYLPKDLQIEEKNIKSTLTTLKIRLMHQHSPRELDSLKLKLLEQELALEKFSKRLRQRMPAYVHYRQSSEEVRISKLQEQLLDSHTALLSYAMTQDNLFVFVVTKRAVKWLKLPYNQSVKQVIVSLKQALYENPGISLYSGHKPAQQAYQHLFAPIRPYLAHTDRLIIIRDKELNYIPFEVLETNSDTHDFLIKSYAIRYAYGASGSATIQSTAKVKTPKTILAMAPFSDPSIQKNIFRDKSLQPLPASLQEIHSVGGTQYINRQATKSVFAQQYATSKIIHLATHARTDDENAERSFIAFYPTFSDYKLYTPELYDMSFTHTRMVVLSACETGRGKLHRGEGLMSLARGFLYGGCPSVVTTLWNAHDQSSAYLSERMYFHLRQGLSIDRALQLAKLDFFQSNMGVVYDHPYYWANLILIGDDSVLYESQDHSLDSKLLIGLGALAILVLAFAVQRIRIQR